jgi:hypothetical protein
VELIKEIGAFAGLAAFLGLAVLAMLAFSQGRDLRRLREWAGSAPERDTERKESTSEAAAKRAEELRALEEARTSERAALDQREERRERLGEGFSSFGSRIAEPRYLIGIFVVVLLIAAGAVYVATQGSDSADGKDGKAKSAKATKPGEIEVTVLNGTAVPGLAAEFGDKVEGKGFKLGAVTNSSTSFAESLVMFERGHAPEARKVAKALGISQVKLMSADIESVSGGAPVSVIVGEDNAATG